MCVLVLGTGGYDHVCVCVCVCGLQGTVSERREVAMDV